MSSTISVTVDFDITSSLLVAGSNEIFDITFNEIEKDKPIGIFIKSLMNKIGDSYHAISLRNGSKCTGYFGYKYQLHKKFSDYDDFKSDNKIYLHSHLNWQHSKFKIYYPIFYYDQGRVFPPTENWNEGDPINLAEFLIFNGWGSGSTNVEQKDDNKYTNLMIVDYSIDGKNFKKCVNIYSYMLSVLNNGLDVFTMKKISSNTIKDIVQIVQRSKVLCDPYPKQIIPEVNLQFVN